jgi:hypothetical protein
MADAPVVHIGENSPEFVAFRLLHTIAYAEGVKIYGVTAQATQPANRKWILDTYSECLYATHGRRLIPGQ